MITGSRPSGRAPATEAAGAFGAGRFGATTVAIAVVVAAVAAVATIGADTRWLGALGKAIVAQRAIPDGVPYAAAPSAGWPNVPVLAELAFDWLAGLGNRGFVAAQAVAVGGAFMLLASDIAGAAS